MKKIFIILMLFAFSIGENYAQRLMEVTEDGRKYAVINNASLPFVLNKADFVAQFMRADGLLKRYYYFYPNVSYGMMMSKRVIIAPTDATIDGTAAGSNTMTWAEAFGMSTDANSTKYNVTPLAAKTSTGCNAYYVKADQSDKGKWRIPTQHEVAAMGLLRSLWKNVESYTDLATGKYWMSREYYVWNDATSYDKAYSMDFNNYVYTKELKTTANRVRCVRDID